MAIDVVVKLADVGLFRKRRPHERLSQYERACEVRDQFAECMNNTLRGTFCVMPELCARGDACLSCAHLHVDYSNFTGQGIPLTKHAAQKIDARLRAIGTLVYRQQNWFAGALPGDKHLPALKRISTFTGARKASRVPASTRATKGKDRGFFARMLGLR